jgi:hypothetical protein
MTALPPFVAILDSPQFTRWDVTAVAEISDGQLKGILDRKQVVLSTKHNPGSGHRRMFTGSDVLKIVVAVSLSRCGFPLEFVHLVADALVRRAASKLAGLTDQPNFCLAAFPVRGGKRGEQTWTWQIAPVWDDMPERPHLPPFVHLIAADVVIDQILNRLQMLIEEAPGPTGPLKYLPGWTTERTLVGLDEAETAEFSELAGQAKSAGRNPHHHARYRELWAKYDEAFRMLAAANAKDKEPSHE